MAPAALESTSNIHIQAFAGQEAKKYFEEIARIRLTLFSEYPYLYQGTTAYEREYLETYFSSPQAVILLVFDGNENKQSESGCGAIQGNAAQFRFHQIVGFSNSIPLEEELDAIKAPFIQKGLSAKDYLYIGEVMLYPQYQGKGILRKFLEFHENKARNEGYAYTVLMTVERSDNHPLTPEHYRPLDPVWKHFGYEQMSGLQAHLAWTQVDTKKETDNTLVFWQKSVGKL